MGYQDLLPVKRAMVASPATLMPSNAMPGTSGGDAFVDDVRTVVNAGRKDGSPERIGCADQAAEGFFSMGLAVSPSAGYARMNSRAFSGSAAFSQAPYAPSFKIANMRFSLPGCP